jgi:hypothetical protein
VAFTTRIALMWQEALWWWLDDSLGLAVLLSRARPHTSLLVLLQLMEGRRSKSSLTIAA